MSFFYPKRRIHINDDIKQAVSEAVMAQPPKNTLDLSSRTTELTRRLFNSKMVSTQDLIAKYLKMDQPNEENRAKVIQAATQELQHILQGKEEGEKEGPAEFSFPRLLGSIIFLLVILGLGFLTASVDQWQSFSPYLQHAFELLLGGTVALIVGGGEK